MITSMMGTENAYSCNVNRENVETDLLHYFVPTTAGEIALMTKTRSQATNEGSSTSGSPEEHAQQDYNTPPTTQQATSDTTPMSHPPKFSSVARSGLTSTSSRDVSHTDISMSATDIDGSRYQACSYQAHPTANYSSYPASASHPSTRSILSYSACTPTEA